jgi:hypothetical protein
VVTTSSEPGELLPEPVRKPPTQVIASFWILIASAALRVVIAAITLASWNSIIDQQLRNPLPANTTAAQARDAFQNYLTYNIVLDVVFGGLYVLFAYRIRAGRNWARLTMTAIVVIFGLFDILGRTDGITLISVIVELVAVALLYMRGSKEYFAKVRPE